MPTTPAFPRYFVSLAVMDPEAGSNPVAGHTTLLISRQKTALDKIEALEAVSFYGIPPSSDPKGSWSKWIKRQLKLDVDLFTGGYGQLQREEARFINLGKGIRGINYVIDENAFENLIDILKTQHENEQQAIKDAEAILKERGEKTVRYHGKDCYTARAILQEEIKLADLDGRAPRLGPWEIYISLKEWGLPTLRESKTCKTGTLKWLKHAGICQDEATRFGDGHSTGAFPRFFSRFNYQGATPTSISLHSIGPKQTHMSQRTGKATVYNEWGPTFGKYDTKISYSGDKATRNKMFWSIPPQSLKLSATTKDCDLHRLENEYRISEPYCDQATTLIHCFQDLHEFLMQSSSSDFASHDPQSFGILNAVISGFIQDAFTSPHRNKSTDYLQQTIAKGQHILQNIKSGLASAEGLCTLPTKSSKTSIRINLSLRDRSTVLRLLAAHDPAPATIGCQIL